MSFVLDNSVVMRWLLRDADGARAVYAAKVLSALADGHHALVPSLWWLELSNVMVRSERKGKLDTAESHQFTELVRALPIQEISIAGQQVLQDTLTLARRHALSSYDAAYLNLALKNQIPLATLDSDLRQAATEAGVQLFLETC